MAGAPPPWTFVRGKSCITRCSQTSLPRSNWSQAFPHGANAMSVTVSKNSSSGQHMARWVYSFGNGVADGKAGMRALLGGKGANLAEMSSLGLPVPPGFTITTEVCSYFYAHERRYPEDLAPAVDAAVGEIERELGMRFGDPENPLLVSVRSGAPVSMPGMMDT